MDRERGSSFLPSPPSKNTLFEDYMSLSEEEDLANCLVMLSNKSRAHEKEEMSNFKGKEVEEKSTFQCKACKKVFNSHQALGGHRASHKKKEEQDARCSVCCRVFSSGQALGGHKRCHWLTTSTDNAFIPNFHDFQYDHRSQQLCKKPLFPKPPQQHHNILDHDHQLDLNLNLPPAPPQHNQKRDDPNHLLDAEEARENEASTRLCLHQPKPGEEGCGMKLRKLSVLRDVNLDGGWLQMGIHSTTEMS
ncbi:zinc finger protein AZF2-like [Salvia splendens]|uniref:zinc finger protein AZF2-like n=1 Tax=Salvia splendens TaxID=180675 RepID=UPI001C27ED81|nr:zinc finger protein AZF2-like [Salvia splendens]